MVQIAQDSQFQSYNFFHMISNTEHIFLRKVIQTCLGQEKEK